MSRITQKSRSTLRLLACGLVVAAIVTQAAPAYAANGEPAPYQHDAGTALESRAPVMTPYQHDSGTAGFVRARSFAPYQHDMEPSADPGRTGPAAYVHDLEPSADPRTPEAAAYVHDLEPSADPAASAGDVAASEEAAGFDWVTAGIILGAILGVFTLAAAGGTAVRQSRRRVARH
jgi:hypothetical protein